MAGARPPKADFPGHLLGFPGPLRRTGSPAERTSRPGWAGSRGAVRGGGHRRPVRPGGGQLPGRGRRQAAAPDPGPDRRPHRRPGRARLVGAAVAIELTHLSNVYDDVMDEAELRRGACARPTPATTTRWPCLPATTCSPGPPEVRRPRHRGDPGPGPGDRPPHPGPDPRVRGPGPDDDPVDHYLEVLADKTGALIAAACRLGGFLSGADASVVAALAEFGERVGRAFSARRRPARHHRRRRGRRQGPRRRPPGRGPDPSHPLPPAAGRPRRRQSSPPCSTATTMPAPSPRPSTAPLTRPDRGPPHRPGRGGRGASGLGGRARSRSPCGRWPTRSGPPGVRTRLINPERHADPRGPAPGVRPARSTPDCRSRLDYPPRPSTMRHARHLPSASH